MFFKNEWRKLVKKIVFVRHILYTIEQELGACIKVYWRKFTIEENLQLTAPTPKIILSLQKSINFCKKPLLFIFGFCIHIYITFNEETENWKKCLIDFEIFSTTIEIDMGLLKRKLQIIEYEN